MKPKQPVKRILNKTPSTGKPKELKHSDILEGQNSSLKQAFDRCCEQKPKELDWMKPRGKSSRFQRIWTNMNTRCYCQKSDNYKNYGGRGIGIDWKTFKDFYEDMYPSWLIHLEQFGKKDTTIDRKDVNGNYSKDNCKWSTIKEQYTNRRDTHMISTYRVSQGLGVVMTSFKRWVKKYGVDVAVKNIVDEKLTQQRTELLEEIKKKVKRNLETYIWDRGLGEHTPRRTLSGGQLSDTHDTLEEIMENRKLLNERVLKPFINLLNKKDE